MSSDNARDTAVRREMHGEKNKDRPRRARMDEEGETGGHRGITNSAIFERINSDVLEGNATALGRRHIRNNPLCRLEQVQELEYHD
jgi:hypothetical protein